MKITIPEPCHEDWSKMTSTQIGRFCRSCEKEVVDFTQLNKEEIKDYFKQKSSLKTCGRFEKKQLEKLNNPEGQDKKPIIKPWWVAAATLLLFAKQGYSQGNLQPVTKGYVAQQDNLLPKVSLFHSFKNQNKIKKFVVTGTIIDTLNQETIPFGNVLLKGTKFGCSSDLEGNFSLVFYAEETDSAFIEINIIGFEKKKIELDLKKDTINLGAIRLTISESKIVGFIVVDDVTTGLIDASFSSEIPKDTIIEEQTIVSSSVTITGKVMDTATNEPIFFATVAVDIDSVRYGAATDFDGNFSFTIPKTNADSITIEASFIGLKTIKRIVKTKTGTIDLEEIKMGETDGVLIGEFVMGGPAQIPISNEPKTINNSNFFMRLFR